MAMATAMTTEIKEVSSTVSSKFEWKIKNFSMFTKVSTYSDVFTVGKLKWRMQIYPKGVGIVYDHLTIYIYPVDLKKSVNTEFIVAVTSQSDPSYTVKNGGEHKFYAGMGAGSGWIKFMPLSELHDPAKGYIVNDTCVITVEITCKVKEEASSGNNGVKTIANY